MRIGDDLEVTATTTFAGPRLRVEASNPVIVDTPDGGEDVSHGFALLDRREAEQLREACDLFLEGRAP